MTLSNDLCQKSIQAALSAIELYNKPTFQYREESFALLMTNAWELLFKAKWVFDRNEEESSLYIAGSDGVKLNRSGNAQSHGLPYLSSRLLEDRTSGVEKACDANVLALIEIRDNAAHFLNRDMDLAKTVLEIGTASLLNYLGLATKWFAVDFTIYNFFLMPVSFYHGFETVEAAGVGARADTVNRLLYYLDGLIRDVDSNEGDQHVAIRIETNLVRSNNKPNLEFRWTEDPDAPALAVREEDVLKNYPIRYSKLTEALKDRYIDFKANQIYHKQRKAFEANPKLCVERLLDPDNVKSSRQKFYNGNIFKEFDKFYTKRSKLPAIAVPAPAVSSLAAVGE